MMNSGSVLAAIWAHTSTYRLIMLFATLSLICHYFPLQHYFTLSRYQHHGLSLFIAGVGFIVQSIWSWKPLRKWGRLSVLGSGLFFASAGLIYYTNPWIGSSIDVNSEANEQFKQHLVALYITFSAALMFCWVRWLMAEHKESTQDGPDRKADARNGD